MYQLNGFRKSTPPQHRQLIGKDWHRTCGRSEWNGAGRRAEARGVVHDRCEDDAEVGSAFSLRVRVLIALVIQVGVSLLGHLVEQRAQEVRLESGREVQARDQHRRLRFRGQQVMKPSATWTTGYEILRLWFWSHSSE